MIESISTSPRVSTGRVLVVCIVFMASMALFAWPSDVSLPAGVFSVTSFFLVPFFFPRSGFYSKPLICPVNGLNAAFFLQLVAMPITVRLFGELHFFLPHLPTDASTNLGTVLITIAYWAFAAGVQRTSRPRAFRALPAVTDVRESWPVPKYLIVVFAILGLLGLAAKHKSLGGFYNFLRAPALYVQAQDRNGASASLLDVVAEFFSFFFGLSLVMVWARIIEHGNRIGVQSRLRAPLMLLPITAAFASYNYNRGNFVFPLIAVAAGVTIRAPQTLKRNVILIGCIGAFLVMVSIIYRNSSASENIGQNVSVDALNKVDQMELFQLYGQAPQYVGIMLEAANYGAEPRYGVLSFSSAASLLPVVGKLLRPLSGYVFYAAVTGHGEENPPFVGEVYLDFNIPGVMAAYLLIGLSVGYLQRRVLGSQDVFETYVFQLMSVYLISTVLLGIEELSLFAVYSMFPVNCYLVIRQVLLRLGRRRTQVYGYSH